MSNISRRQDQGLGKTAAGGSGGSFASHERDTGVPPPSLPSPAQTPRSEVSVHEVMTNWSCADCSYETTVPLTDLPDIGTPVCGDCGDDMDLGDTVSVPASDTVSDSAFDRAWSDRSASGDLAGVARTLDEVTEDLRDRVSDSYMDYEDDDSDDAKFEQLARKVIQQHQEGWWSESEYEAYSARLDEAVSSFEDS